MKRALSALVEAWPKQQNPAVPRVHPSLRGHGRRVDPGRVLALLKKREAALRAKTVAFLLLGIPLSFIGPAFFTAVGWAFWIRAHRALYPPPYPWLTAFVIISAVSLPLFYLLAWSYRGSSVLEQHAEDLDTFTGRRHAGGLMVLELANIGPRMVMHAITTRAGRRRAGNVDLEHAAEAVCTMSATDSAVSPAKLLRPGEPPEALEPLLTFLMFHQLADISAAGDRVWLNSDVRRAIENAR
jgi:hypothetical protein